jgi:hypothetical protein
MLHPSQTSTSATSSYNSLPVSTASPKKNSRKIRSTRAGTRNPAKWRTPWAWRPYTCNSTGLVRRAAREYRVIGCEVDARRLWSRLLAVRRSPVQILHTARDTATGSAIRARHSPLFRLGHLESRLHNLGDAFSQVVIRRHVGADGRRGHSAAGRCARAPAC